MAFHGQRFLGLHLGFDQIRYRLSYLSSCSLLRRFSIVESQSNFTNHSSSPNQSTVDERYVLGEISKLLPISSVVSNRCTENTNNSMKEVGNREFDAFLLPEEKLRGVFLQKMKGKTAIENCLESVGADLSLVVVARVVDSGNLSGEAMVMFFRWAIKQPGVAEDIHSYNVILKALGRRKFFKFMMEIFHDMGTRGVNPSSETLTIVIDSFVRAHYVRRAVKLFENLEEFGMKRDTESFNVLLLCLCRRSHVSAAYSIFNTKKGKILYDNATYNILISGWSKLGEVHATEKVLREMVDGGFSPDCSTFSYLIEGLARTGRIDDAIKIFDHITDNGSVPDTSVYNAMISNFISVGDLDQSLKYYRLMLDSECDPNLDTYSKLISAFLKVRKVADALEMFEEMLSRRIVPTTGIITSFLEPLCSFGPPHAAMVIYQKSRKIGCRVSPSAYKLLLMRLSRFGKCGMLFSVWDEMQENGYPCDMEVYEYIVNGLCNIGHLNNAVLVVEEALRKGFCPGRVICSKLNNKLLASNKTETAYKLFLKIKKARRHENARRFWRANGWHF